MSFVRNQIFLKDLNEIFKSFVEFTIFIVLNTSLGLNYKKELFRINLLCCKSVP